MSSAVPKSTDPITSKDQLKGFFESGIKDPRERRVGMEHEKFMLRKDTLAATPYDGPSGIGRLFELMCERHGFTPDYDGPNIISALRKNNEGLSESLTIEPGGQFELSGAPLSRMSHIEAELDRHLAEIGAISDELGLLSIGMGANGLHELDEVPWMPKRRYGIMRRYMDQVGTLGHWMMKMTCTVQANFDYTSEADAADMLRTSMWISPIISALFARSPIWRRKPSGYMTTRCFFWTDTDNDRCGFPPFMLSDEGFGFADYVNYTLDVPMYLIVRDGEYIDMSGKSFVRFIEDGFEGHRATMGDYELHLSTLFPEVRMKRYIEVRGADCGPRDHLLALPALWKGLLYDQSARDNARRLVSALSLDERGRLFTNAIRWSLDGPAPGTGAKDPTMLREWASALIDLAAQGLGRLAQGDEAICDPDASRHLDVLRAAVSGEEKSPAHAMLARWHALGGDTGAWMREQVLTAP